MRSGRWTTLPGVCALVSGTVFVVTRLWLEHALGATGHTGGLLQYDSYYQFSFARELRREGHLLFFRNPFGSFDRHPGLFNGPATVLRLTHPLWDGHLFAFDLVLGAVCAGLAGWFFGRILETVAPQVGIGTYAIAGLALVGGGIGFVLHQLGVYTDPRSGLLGTAYWGPTWVTNDIGTWELLYHAVFWAGLAALIARKVLAPLLLASALAFLHPFSIASFGMVSVLLWFAWRPRRSEVKPDGRAVAGIAVITAVTIAIYQWLLPDHSRDARFILQMYKATNFHLPITATLAFLAPALLLAVARILASRSAPRRAPVHPAALGLALSAACFVLLSLSADVTTLVPQPAHWIRVYPFGLLLLAVAGMPFTPGIQTRRARWLVASGLGVLLAIAGTDSVLALRAIKNDLATGGPPVLLTNDEAALISRLRSLPSKPVVYIRPCERRSPSPDLEYAISALTDDPVGIGHAYFTPLLGQRMPRYLACNQTPSTLRTLVAVPRYIVRDAGAGPSLRGVKSLGRVGRFELMTSSTAHPSAAPAEGVGSRGDGA